MAIHAIRWDGCDLLYTSTTKEECRTWFIFTVHDARDERIYATETYNNANITIDDAVDDPVSEQEGSWRYRG